LSSERDWYRDQYDALDALVKAMQTDSGWLEYRLQAVRDELLEEDAQAAEDVPAVVKVRGALLERDELLQKAREDAAAMRTVAAEWETEVASLRTELEQGRATLEGARSCQSQAKEAEQLRTSLADKAASLASTEERLQREWDARQQADAQLQQEQAALTEAQAALERERLAREEAHGRLQQERVVLKGPQETLKQRDEEVSWLNGEFTQLSVSHEDLHQSLEEQEATVLSLL
jgi:DNA repair exonuclease SbcCD ATPase subunit